jgi:hypothetical protein
LRRSRATGLERWIPGVIQNKYVSLARIDPAIVLSGRSKRISRQLVNEAEGTGLVITIGGPRKQIGQMLPVQYANSCQRAAEIAARLHSVRAIAVLLCIVLIAWLETRARACAELELRELAFDGDATAKPAEQHVNTGRAWFP